MAIKNRSLGVSDWFPSLPGQEGLVQTRRAFKQTKKRSMRCTKEVVSQDVVLDLRHGTPTGKWSHMGDPKTETDVVEAQPQVFGNPQVVHSAQPPSTYATSYSPSSTTTGIQSAFPCNPNPMSLLTPSESRAFHSFLDAAAFPVDWSMQLEISHEHMPPARGTEALTKATKDLMSLDGEKWRFPSGSYPSQSSAAPAHRQQPLQPNPLTLLYSTRQPRSMPPLADEAELAHLSAARLGLSSPQDQLSFHHVLDMNALAYDRSSSSGSSRESPADLLTASSSSTRLTSAKRSPPLDATPSNKRHRPSVTMPQNDEEQLVSQSKSVLLSPSQKKANHIQSEQKRRANIRRGYDALCETVPALREACLVEDEQQLEEGKSKSRRKGKGRGKDDSERIDGRAGPRSENVVLSKTIDYVHELLSEREALMQRLHVARSALPVDHPLLRSQPDAPLPLWERKWTGGEKRNDDEEDEEDE